MLPERPPSVPPDATWNEGHRKWELAQSIAGTVGLVRRWRPDGTLASEFHYFGGKLSAFSFHPNSELSGRDAWAVDWSPAADEVREALRGLPANAKVGEFTDIHGQTAIDAGEIRVSWGGRGVVWAIDWSPTADEVSKALGGLAAEVDESARIHGPILGEVGQFVVRLAADGREVGVFVRAYRCPIDQSPAFWINTVEDTGQVVLLAQGGQIAIDRIPGDWTWTDYLRERPSGPTRLSNIALNPLRHVRRLAIDRSIIAESDFTSVPAAANVLARTRFWMDKSVKEVRAFSTMAYNVRDADQARRLLDALERLRAGSQD